MSEIKIEVNKISKSFGNNDVIKNLSLKFYEDKVYGIVGDNGVGKSTLLNCILGIEDLDKGEIFVEKVKVNVGSKELYRNVGIQFQELYYQNKIKVGEYCRMIAAAYDNITACEKMLIELGFQNQRNIYVKDLSRGQKQQLGFLTALLGNPSILFFDEPTAGMDMEHRGWCLQRILNYKMKKKCTILYISHNSEDLLNIADVLIVLKENFEVIHCDFFEKGKKEKEILMNQLYFQKNQLCL